MNSVVPQTQQRIVWQPPATRRGAAKEMAKRLASFIKVADFEKAMAFSIVRSKFPGLAGDKVKVFETREQIREWLASSYSADQEPWTFIEFGVFEGHSIKYFASKRTNPESEFIGLDSFEGLPEAWGTKFPRGAFNLHGKLPEIGDPRVTLIKGWFQDSWPELSRRLQKPKQLVVHYDADLYAPTMFALAQMDSLKRPYVALFDEFTGHESRALYNYVQAFDASVVFLAKALLKSRYPSQVVCKITPRNAA